MLKQNIIPKQTRNNWLVNFAALFGIVLMMFSGTILLVFPSSDGGSSLHSFGSALNIVAMVTHLVLHWQWVKTMAGRCIQALSDGGNNLSQSVRRTVIIDTLIAISFLVTMATGFALDQRSESGNITGGAPVGGVQGRLSNNFLSIMADGVSTSQTTVVERVASPAFRWATLDLIHLGAVAVFLILISIHLWMHWRWITNTTGRFFLSVSRQPGQSRGLGAETK